MAGPTTPALALMTLIWSGPNLPYGAQSSIGILDTDEPWADGVWQSAIDSALTSAQQSISTQGCTLVEARVKVGPEASGPTYVIPIGVNGENGTMATPPNVAMLVRKVVPGVSTRLQGRFYWPCISEGNVDGGGVIGPPAFGQYQGFLDTLFTGLTTGGAELVVFSEPATARPISGLQLQSRVATQRRRLRR